MPPAPIGVLIDNPAVTSQSAVLFGGATNISGAFAADPPKEIDCVEAASPPAETDFDAPVTALAPDFDAAFPPVAVEFDAELPPVALETEPLSEFDSESEFAETVLPAGDGEAESPANAGVATSPRMSAAIAT
jgi:hypothetical protein